MDVFDVRIHAMRRRRNRRRPFEVRWHVSGRGKSRSFITRGLADSYRAEPVRAARQGLAFDLATGEPSSWAGPGTAAVTWHEHAVAYAAMKWPHAAAHTRAGIADALATITPALVTSAAGRPPAAVLRAALYAHAYNPPRSCPAPGTEAARALAWAERHSLPLADLQDPRVTLDTAAPRTAAAWTATGTSHGHRGLKQRPAGTRAIPIPPGLVRLLDGHLRDYGTAPGGRLFAGARGGILSESTYGRAWHTARTAALGPGLAATPLARRPYHAPASQRDSAGPHRTQDTIPPPAIWPLTCTDMTSAIPSAAADRRRAAHHGHAPAGR